MKGAIRLALAGILGAAVAIAAGVYLAGGFTKGDGIKPGFVGVVAFGHWRLICVPAPTSLEILVATTVPEPKKTPANACRVNQEVANPTAPDKNNAIIAALNFSLLGAKHMPAVMLRLPATAKPGDQISLSLDEQNILATTVRECATECLAAGALSRGDWTKLARATSMQIALPVKPGQAALLDVPTDGLSASLAAMARAEN